MSRFELKPWHLYRPMNILRRLFLRKPHSPAIQPVSMAWGGQLRFDVSRAIGWGALTTGVVDLALSEMVCHLAKPGDSVLDVGANVGGISCLMARVVKDGSVDAFEPHPVVGRMLEENCRLNLEGMAYRVRLHRLALSNKAGTVNLIEDPQATSDGQASIGEVRPDCITHAVQTDLLAKQVPEGVYSVMKLDVEGHELEVLQGAGGLIADKKIQHILFEDHEGRNSEVCRFLESNGYSLYSFGWELTGVRIVPIAEGNLNKVFEAPNYLASAEPLKTNFLRGWKCLGGIDAG